MSWDCCKGSSSTVFCRLMAADVSKLPATPPVENMGTLDCSVNSSTETKHEAELGLKVSAAAMATNATALWHQQGTTFIASANSATFLCFLVCCRLVRQVLAGNICGAIQVQHLQAVSAGSLWHASYIASFLNCDVALQVATATAASKKPRDGDKDTCPAPLSCKEDTPCSPSSMPKREEVLYILHCHNNCALTLASPSCPVCYGDFSALFK